MVKKMTSVMDNETADSLQGKLPTCSDAPGSREAVVLIHGLGSSRVLMLPLAYQIRSAGYHPKLFGYFTFFSSIPRHAQRFCDYVRRLEADPGIRRWHIVAHSMGSIITRQMLCSTPFDKLGRVVMLSPPNHGSRAAKLLSYLVPLSQTVKQITNERSSFVRQMPSPEGIEIGVVAASHDRVVTKASSHLPTESDHITVYSGHNGLLVRKRAATEVLEFLKHGKFTHRD